MNISNEGPQITSKFKVVSLKELEFLHIVHAMFAFSGNRTKVSRAIGFSIRTLRNKLNEYEKERRIVFPMTGCNSLSKAEFRHVFLNFNKLAEEKFQFPDVEVAEQTVKVLVSEFGFPSYLMDRISNDFEALNAKFVDRSS